MALTNTSFRKAKATGKDYSLNGLDGLLLFVGIKGAKKWHFRFLWMGKQFCVALGAYPEISLKEARALRDELRVQVAKGVDPHAYRSQAQEAASAAHLTGCLHIVAQLQGSEPEDWTTKHAVADRPYFCQGRVAVDR